MWIGVRFRSYWALTLAMQKKWQIFAKDFIKEWVEYPFLAMPANANAIANSQCERTLSVKISRTGRWDLV